MTKTKWYTKPIYVLVALVLVLSFSLVMAVPAAAKDVTVSEFTSIQAAIDAPTTEPGDTIIVAAGTYDEDITIDKDLTLNGAQAGVDARGRAGDESHITGSIKVTSDASNITIDGFKITGTGAGPLAGVCMRVEAATATIKNNIIEAVEATGGYTYSGFVDLDGVSDVLMEQNYIYGAYEADRAPNVIRLGVASGGTTITVQNNELDDVGGGGGIGISCGNADAVINVTGNEFNHTGDGVWVWNGGGSNFNTLSITDNDIHHCNACHGAACENTDTGIKLLGTVTGTVVITGNDFQDNSIQVDDTAKVLDIDFVLANNTFDRAVVVRSSPIIKVPIIFSSIQDAVNAAVASDTVIVKPGIYDEDVTIATSLRLLGEKRGVPAGPAANPVNRDLPSEESIIDGSIRITGVNQTIIDGFTILSGDQHGIWPTDGGDVILNNIIEGSGIIGKSGIFSGGGGDYLIANNNIRNYGRFGITFDGGEADPQCTISGNYITNITGENTAGIQTQGSWSNGHIFVNNLIENCGAGIVLAQGEHQVSGNTIRNNSGSGILLWGTTRTFGIQITQNTIEGNVTGIKLWPDDAGAVNNQAHFNNIVGNADGVINDHSAVFDATNNWWGSASGPKHALNTYTAPGGEPQGNAVSDYVDYVPWLGALSPGGAPFAPITLDAPPGQFSSIQAAIDAVSGTTITCKAGTYNHSTKLSIDKSLTLLGPNAGISPNTGARVDEAILTGEIVQINDDVNDVVIDGFKFNITTTKGLFAALCIGDSTQFGGTNERITVKNNWFTGGNCAAVKTSWLARAINLLVTDNKITDLGGNNISGLLIWGTKDSEVSNNVIDGTTFGGILLDDIDNVVASGNAISNTPFVGIILCGSEGKPVEDITISNNVIDNTNTGETLESGGILLQGDLFTGPVIITRNTVTNSFNGLSVAFCEGSSIADWSHINFNNFTDNKNAGVYYCCGEGTLDALYNWWGDETGPEHTTLNTGAQGNAVSDEVDFSPWLYKTQEEFISGAPCYAGSVVLENEASVVEDTSYAGGWNTFSTPILLDSDASYISDLLALVEGSGLSIVRAQRFDPSNLDLPWAPLIMNDTLYGEDYQIKPGEGFFIQVSTKGSLPILCSTELFWPQSWELSADWNLVGATSYQSNLVGDALASLGTTCTVVNSPGANPISWSYPPAAANKLLLPGRAYWVAMSADGTLMCFDSTPVADDLTWGLNQ